MKTYYRVILIAIVPLTFVLLLNLIQINKLINSEDDYIKERIGVQTKIVKTNLLERVRSMSNSSKILASSEEVVNAMVEGDNEILYRWSKNFINENISNIYFIGKDKYIISRSDNEFRFGDIFDEINFSGINQDAYLGINTLDGKESIIIMNKVKRYGESEIGYVVVAANINKKFLESITKGSDASLRYSSFINTGIMSEDFDALSYSELIDLPINSNSIKNAKFQIDIKESPRLIKLYNIKNNTLIITIALLIILPLITHKLISNYLHPYSRILDAIRDFADHKTDLSDLQIICNREGEKKNNEFSKIAAAIGSMAQKVNTSVDDLRKARNEMEKLATIDALTGIYNRMYLEKILDREHKRVDRYESELSIIMVDIDFFKRINDTHGHLTGDAVLIKFAETIKDNVRDTDIVGRWGGEEFLIISPEININQAENLSNKIRNIVEHLSFPESEKITSSFGVAQYKKGESITKTISRADKALYKAKELGRNQVVTDYADKEEKIKIVHMSTGRDHS